MPTIATRVAKARKNNGIDNIMSGKVCAPETSKYWDIKADAVMKHKTYTGE
jgi:hypothetical protein